MQPAEIQELMDVKGWSRTQLAANLDVTENTVHQWMSGRRIPGGPAVILMRRWLADCKKHTVNGRRAHAHA